MPGEQQGDSGCVLEVKPTGPTGGLEVEGERKRVMGDSFRILEGDIIS